MTVPVTPVLVATDLSARSDRAVDRACSLARLWDVPLKVLHAVEPGTWIDKNAALASAAVLAVLPDPTAAADVVLAHEPAPQAIVRTAQEAGCGLIVTGAARFNQAGDFIIGTAVDHTVRHAEVPVLVVKQRAHAPYRSILIATDLSSCSRLALNTAASMFPDAAIHLLHVYDVPYEGWPGSEDERQDLVEQARSELEGFLGHPAIAPDLLVLGTHGRSGFIQAIVGSRAESLLFWSRTDTLMVREVP